jgi:hypothetical protein
MKSAKCLSKTGQQHSLLFWLVAGLGLLAARDVFATEYYVAPTGSDSNPGTQDSPFATLQKGADTAAAGDTVWIRGGTYKITTPKNSGAGIELSKSGTSDTNRIKYWAYSGETPLFDFSNLQIANGAYTFGFVISGSWLHLKGLEECCVPMNTKANNGFANNGHDNTFELLNAHNNQGSGIQIGGEGGNLALNCDSHDNFDPGSTNGGGAGEDADGFGVHGGTSGTTTIRGCRAWWNSDDGYDFLSNEAPVTIENSWAMGAGYSNYGTGAGGNGNGFKMGSSKTGVRHTITNCVAWKNKANGFYANHSSGGNTWYNNTSFQNGTQYNMLASTWSEPNGKGTRTDGVTLSGDKAHILRNNIGFPNDNQYVNGYGVDTKFNTWDLNIVPAAKDFLSVTDPSLTAKDATVETLAGAIGPRQADGSLPNVDFLKLAAGSAMIDKGTDVQLPFVGAAPDLGAYEFGATGGSSGGGSTGAAGAGGGGSTGAAGVGGGGSTGAAGAGRGGSAGAAGAGGGGAKSGGAGGGTSVLGGTSGGGGSVAGSTTVAATGGTGILGSGGTSAAGGAPGSGGTTTADTSATGGSTSAGAGGATVETGGTSTVVPETGGSAGSGTGSAAGGESGTEIHKGGSSSGCSYGIGATAGRTSAGSLLAMLGVLGLVRYRRRR